MKHIAFLLVSSTGGQKSRNPNYGLLVSGQGSIWFEETDGLEKWSAIKRVQVVDREQEVVILGQRNEDINRKEQTKLLPLYFPRDKHEEEIAISKLPADVGDENGETIIDERKIRISALPAASIASPKAQPSSQDVSVNNLALTIRRNSSYIDSLVDPSFMSLSKDPDQRRKEQWEKVAQAQAGWSCAKWLGLGDLGGPPLSAAEEYSLHARYLARANAVNLTEVAEMKIV
eukprot:Gb_02659 [translate_table: standard]